MGKKIFVSYKYSDSDVTPLTENTVAEIFYPTTVRNYVDNLQTLLDAGDNINKGEADGEDLSDFKDSTIQSKLRDKIYDSSVTIVMISPNMKESCTPESDQWIPWEMSYSLKEHTRNGRTSQTNAMLAIVLPDRNGSYDYHMEYKKCQGCSCKLYNTNIIFQIHKDNLFNVKKPTYKNCTSGDTIYLGDYSYIHTVRWNDFIASPSSHISQAELLNDKIATFNITKTIN